MYRPFGTQTLGGVQPKYSSGKEYLQKAQDSMVEQEKAQEMLQKARPALETLLKSRLASKTPIVITQPMPYMTNELVTKYGQYYDEKEGWVDDKDDPKGSYFQDVRKALPPGTQLILKGLDPNLREFIFENQHGEEVALPYNSQEQLMMYSNIYSDVMEFMNNYQGE